MNIQLPNFQHSGIEYGFSSKKEPLSGSRLNDIVFAKQVHGDGVVWVDEKNTDQKLVGDALLTKTSGITIGVRTADCVPIILVDPEQRIVGVVHAGWKGSLKCIAEKAVEQIKQQIGSVQNIHAIVGSAIGECCYSVHATRAHLFIDAFPEWQNEVIQYLNDIYYLSLGELNKLQLERVGVKRENIVMQGSCTMCQRDKYPSYRRDGRTSKEQQIVSWVTLV
jgi:YfiH family protein